MLNTRQSNVVLGLMLALHATWLFTKGKVGTVEHQDNAMRLFYLTLSLGGLVIAWPVIFGKWASRLFQRLISLLKVKRLYRVELFIILFLAGIAILDQLFIPLITEGPDEVLLIRAAQIVLECGPVYFFENYTEVNWLGKQHPPLPVLSIAYVSPLFGGALFLASRTLTSLLSLGIAGCTFLIAKRLYGKRVAFFAMILLYALRKFFLHHVISGNDVYVTFFFSLTVLLLLRMKTIKYQPIYKLLGLAVATGLSISLGFLSKYTMAFSFVMPLAVLLWPFPYPSTSNGFLAFAPNRIWLYGLLWVVIAATALPWLIGWFYFLYEYDYLQHQFSFLATYLHTDVEWSPATNTVAVKDSNYANYWRLNFTLMAIIRKLPTAIGLYHLPLIGLGLWSWASGKQPAWSNRFIGFWLASVFIPVLIMLPVDRYFMPAFPALAIMMATGINTFIEKPTRVVGLALFFSVSSMLIYMH